MELPAPVNEFQNTTTQAMKTHSFCATLTPPSKSLMRSEEKKMMSGENHAVDDDSWLFLGAGSDEKNVNSQDENFLSNAFLAQVIRDDATTTNYDHGDCRTSMIEKDHCHSSTIEKNWFDDLSISSTTTMMVCQRTTCSSVP